MTLDVSQLKSLQGIYPLVIEKYERFIPNIEGMGVPEKINSIIQYLNQIGKISNDVVRDWNKVMKWILDEGLNESVVANIESLIAAGRFDDLIQEALVEVDGRLDSVESSLADIANCKQYGFVADYQGTPQYDGNDGSRITCTDNTAAFAAMLDDCIAKKNLTVFFPKGHYGIKTGNINKDLTGCSLTIIGHGYEETIIDFVKEDNTNVAYVDETKASVIATISNFKFLKMKDIQIKATTNYNNIGGNITDPNAVYYGAVWGLILDNFDTVILDKVKVTKFNYRGISTRTTGGTTLSTMSKKVFVKDCFFTENKSSGLWLTQLQSLIVDGGEYSYNGMFGTTGTGYGITASAQVGKCFVKNAWFHHNYRKGFDTHGCVSVEVDNCRFEDNVLYHLVVEAWSMVSDITSGDVIVNNCVFSNGLSPESYTWLQNAYNALIPVNDIIKRGWLWNIDDRKNDRSDQNLIKNVIFTNNSVLCHYNGGDKQANATNGMAYIYAPTAELRMEGNSINLNKWVANTNVSNSACPFNISGTQMHLNRNSFIVKGDFSFGAGKYGALFTMQGTNGNQSLSMKQNNFSMKNCYLFVNTSSGDVTDPSFLAGSMRNFQNNIFEWDVLPATTLADRKLFGAVDNVNYPYQFKNNQVKVNGFPLQQPEGIFTYSEKNFKITTVASAGATTPFMEVIMDDTSYFTFEVYLSTSGEKLLFRNDNSGLTTNTVLTDPVKFGLSSITRFTDTDGRQKVKVTLATKNNTFTAQTMYGYIKVVGMNYSWGIEKINAII